MCGCLEMQYFVGVQVIIQIKWNGDTVEMTHSINNMTNFEIEIPNTNLRWYCLICCF